MAKITASYFVWVRTFAPERQPAKADVPVGHEAPKDVQDLYPEPIQTKDPDKIPNTIVAGPWKGKSQIGVLRLLRPKEAHGGNDGYVFDWGAGFYDRRSAQVWIDGPGKAWAAKGSVDLIEFGTVDPEDAS